MTLSERPKARGGLIAADHSKRGRRFVTVLDPGSLQVNLLEPWEHAVLVLCDGTRRVDEITDLVTPVSEGQPIDADLVRRCLKLFEREHLLEAAFPPAPTDPAPGPKTLVELQQAYREWNNEPVQTGQIPNWLSAPPLDNPVVNLPPGVDPTVAMPADHSHTAPSLGAGSTLVVAGGDPDGPAERRRAAGLSEDGLDVLRAVDSGPAESTLTDEADTHAATPAYRQEPADPSTPRANARASSPGPSRRRSPTPDAALVGAVRSRRKTPRRQGRDETLARTAPDRLRTVTAGERPPPAVSRAVFDRLTALGRVAGKAASFAEVVGALSSEEVGQALALTDHLRLRLPGSRRVAACADALEAAAGSGNADAVARAGCARSLRGLVDEAVAAGWCPVCGDPVPVRFEVCGTCEFSPVSWRER